MDLRKLLVIVEETHADVWERAQAPVEKAAACAVLRNPFAGTYVEDLEPLMEIGEELGALLGNRAASALSGPVESYGKAALVGLAGEAEHAAAILHPRFGKPFRDVIGEARAIIPSTKKVASAGAPLDVPLHHVNAAYVRSHFDTITVQLADAPRDDELLVVAAVGRGGRPHPRVGGLTVDEVTGEDGLR